MATAPAIIMVAVEWARTPTALSAAMPGDQVTMQPGQAARMAAMLIDPMSPAVRIAYMPTGLAAAAVPTVGTPTVLVVPAHLALMPRDREDIPGARTAATPLALMVAIAADRQASRVDPFRMEVDGERLTAAASAAVAAGSLVVVPAAASPVVADTAAGAEDTVAEAIAKSAHRFRQFDN